MAAPSPQNPKITTPASPPTDTTTSTTPPPTFPPRLLLYTSLLLTPTLMLLPPRKLDLYTFALGAVFVGSAQEVALRPGRRERARARDAAMRARGSGDGAGTGTGKGATGVMGILSQGATREDTVTMGDLAGGVRQGLGIGGAGGEKGKDDAREKEWVRRRKEVEREELEERGYSGVILGEVRELLGRDRETGERKGGASGPEAEGEGQSEEG